MATVPTVTLYIRPGGPGDEAPLATFAPERAEALTPILRREAAGIVFVVLAVDEPDAGEDPDRSLGHHTPHWDAPGWDSPGWDEPSWTTSPPAGSGLTATQGFHEDRAVVRLTRRASIIPQLVGLLSATTEEGRLEIEACQLADGYDVDEVRERIEAFLARFAQTNRFIFAP